jgi:hypothetical protein
MSRLVLALLLVLTAISACQPIPARVPFENDRRIFRGIYEGEVITAQGPPLSGGADPLLLRIASTPTYIDQSRYAISGTVTLGDAPPVPFEGEVRGGDTQLYVLTPPIIVPGLELSFDYQGETWSLWAMPSSERTNSPIAWSASFEPESRERPYRYYGVRLEHLNPPPP